MKWLWVSIVALALALGLTRPAAAERVPAGRIVAGAVVVRFEEADRAVATQVAQLTPGALDEVSMSTGDRDPAIEIRIAHSARGMAALAPDDAPPPEWAAGVAYGERNLIVLSVIGPDGVANEIPKVLRHELAHVSLDRAAGGHFIPRWFHEGFAYLTGTDFSWSRTWTLMSAMLHGRIFSLDELSRRFPDGADDAQLAYAESYDFVEYLAEHEGQVGMRALIARVSRGIAFDEAIKQVFHDELGALEDHWLDELRERYLWVPLVTTGLGLWVIGGLLLTLGWRRRRRQNRARLAAWELEESAARAAAAARRAERAGEPQA